MRKSFQILFTLLLIFSWCSLFAQDKLLVNENNSSKTTMIDTWKPLDYHSEGTNAIFTDDMNGDNTVPGIQARGWYFDDVDGAGLTTTFQGNSTVFAAYEGPPEGYLGENFNGAFNGGLLIDQWLISPEVSVSAGDTLKFWQRSPDASLYPDHLQVWISTTAGTTAAAFDVQIGAFDGSTTGWWQYVQTFPAGGTVRFAVRYYVTNGGPNGNESDFIGLDYFEVVSGGPPCPVGVAINPTPTDGATDISLNPGNATWVNGDQTTQVEVFFGPAGSMASVYSGAPVSSYAIPGPLLYATTYNWKVVCKNDTCAGAPAATWSFTTLDDPNLVTVFEDYFENGSTNWTITNDGGTCVWQVFTPPYPNTYAMPNISGGVFAADADECGSSSTLLSTTTLATPLNLSMYQTAMLSFDSHFNALDVDDKGYVDVSIDGGTNWVNVLTYNGVDATAHESIDI
ncbi:MAG: choice-of-anchor J domain-containing protein, partial [Ignavibacteriaceae bacterium]|nr:choice-of-anchor J domain-containing protein [Ignavibacteriaceae bacterium]